MLSTDRSSWLRVSNTSGWGDRETAMLVRELSSSTAEAAEWDAFVRRSPEGSPFHLLAWCRAVEHAFGFRSHYLVAVREQHVEGVLPLFEVRSLLGERAMVSEKFGQSAAISSGGTVRQKL